MFVQPNLMKVGQSWLKKVTNQRDVCSEGGVLVRRFLEHSFEYVFEFEGDEITGNMFAHEKAEMYYLSVDEIRIIGYQHRL